MEKKSSYLEKAMEENIKPIREPQEIEREIDKAVRVIQREYEKILFLTIEKDVGVKITPLRDGGAIVDGEVLTEEDFNFWLDDIIQEYELDKEESERGKKEPRPYDA